MDNSMELFNMILTKDNAERVAQTVIQRMLEDSTGNEGDQIIDYDYRLHKGKIKQRKINTSFKFDTRPGTFLRKLKDTLLEPGHITEEHTEKVKEFLLQIKEVLMKDHKEQLSDAIRTAVLANASKEFFPLSDIEVMNFEIGEKPEIDYVFRIDKSTPNGVIAPSVVEEISAELRETGKSVEEIIADKKAANDANYQYVTGVSKQKAFYECQLDLFVDYSAKTGLVPDKE